MTEISKDCFICGTEIIGKRVDAKYCSKTCNGLAQNRKYRARHPEKVKRQRISEFEHVALRVLKNAKYRAKIRGYTSDLELSDIHVPTHCPVLGIELKTNYGRGSGLHADSPSIDRIEPSKGYMKGNIRIISARANMLKSDATVEELESVLLDLKRLRDVSDLGI